MEEPDVGVCRTCLSPKAKLIEMQQAVPNLESMTYNDVLDYCINIHTPGEQSRRSSTKYPMHICLRCSKALEVSYHFLKMVHQTDEMLQEQQLGACDELGVEDAEQYDENKKDASELMKIAVVIDNKELMLKQQEVSMQPKLQRIMPTAMVCGVQKDQTKEDSQTLKPFTNYETPTKELWSNNVIKSDLSSLSDLKDFDWMDSISIGISDNFSPAETVENTSIKNIDHEDDLFASISQDKYFTDSEATDCAIETEAFDPNKQIKQLLPNNVLATQFNVPNGNSLTEDSGNENKNSLTKVDANAKSLSKLKLNDFVDDVNENDFYDDSGVKEETYSTEDEDDDDDVDVDVDELLSKTLNHLVCGLCNETFTDLKTYSMHINQHKGINPVRCEHCNFFTCYPESMRKHYRKIHDVEPTKSMLDAPINPQKPPKEGEYYAKTYKCSKCTKESHNRREIKVHLLKQHQLLHNIDAFILLQYNCPECSRGFPHYRGMRLHFVRGHGKRKEEAPAPGETFQCQTCAKIFPLQRSLRTHQRICQGPTNIHCNLCNKNHDSVRKFEQHLAKEHAVEMIHACDICGKTFKNAIYLSMHCKRHTTRNFHCLLCSKNYVNKNDLRVHINRIHSTEPKMKCTVCDAKFATLNTLRAHETNVHSKQPHSCTQCDFQTTTASRLKLHQYTHTGMPYRCTRCDKGFALRVFMRRHSIRAHKITLSDTDLAEMFRQNMGYPSRYDVFRNAEYSLNIPEVLEEDIEQELSEYGLNFDDVVRDIFSQEQFNDNDKVFSF